MPWKHKRKNAGVDVDLLRKLLLEFAAVRPYVFGDFYPLTPYSIAPKDWMAWQFDRPDLGGGMVQAFRHSENKESSMTIRLQGLDPASAYTLTNLDMAGTTEMTGRDLLDKGIALAIKEQPGSAVIVYRRTK